MPVVALLAALALAATACSPSTSGVLDDSSSSSAALILRPAEFIGDTPCSAAPGAMRSYVATLVDRTFSEICGDGVCQPHETSSGCPIDCGATHPCGDGVCEENEKEPELEDGKENDEHCPADCAEVPPPFTLPSSLPTSCSQGVRFDNIAAGHFYSVQIDAYEQFADEIGPAGWSTADGGIDYKALRSGSRHMQAADGAPVVPRWRASCGEGEKLRTIAASSGTTAITGCDLLVDAAPGSTEPAVEVAPQDALGVLSCAADAAPGELSVASFDLLPQSGLPGVLGVPCLGEPFVQKYEGDAVVPGTTLEFFVDARAEAGGPVVWGAACSALVQEGLTVRAACSPLSDRGSLYIDVSALLQLFDVECSGDIAGYDAELVAGDVTLSQNDVTCDQDVSFGPLAPGDYEASVAIFTKSGTPLFHAVCAAAVQPGRVTSADCALQ